MYFRPFVHRPVDYLSDTLPSKTTTTVYTSPERYGSMQDWIMLDVIFSAHVKCVSLCYRVVSGKDICTVCHKNMYTDEKIVLDDMNITATQAVSRLVIFKRFKDV